MPTDPVIDEALQVFETQVPDAEAHRTTPVTVMSDAVDWHKKQALNWWMTVQQTAVGGPIGLRQLSGKRAGPGGPIVGATAQMKQPADIQRPVPSEIKDGESR